MEGVVITHGDYSNLLNGRKKDVLIYLDPPYPSSEKSKLYGQNGNLHSNFDHQTFKENILTCNHNVLITYDNSRLIKQMYGKINDFNLFPLNFQYGMNNIYRDRIPKSKELVIINYDSPLIVEHPLEKVKGKLEIKNKPLAQCVSHYIEHYVREWKSERKMVEDIRFSLEQENSEKAKEEILKVVEKLINLEYIIKSRRKNVGRIIEKTSKWNLEAIKTNLNL